MTKNDQSPLVSIIVPVYNGERFLDKFIPSMLDQTYKNIQLIIMNDCSTDRSAQIIRSFMEKDPRIEFYERDQRIGRPYFDDIMPKVRGEYFVQCGCDDYPKHQAIEKLVSCAILENGIDAVFCWIEMVNEKGDLLETEPRQDIFMRTPARDQNEALPFFFKHGSALFAFTLIKTEAFYRILEGEYEVPPYETVSDCYLAFRLARYGNIRVVHEVLHQWTQREDSFMRVHGTSHEMCKLMAHNRKRSSIEDIFPQILWADSPEEEKRIRSECHYQLGVYMSQYAVMTRSPFLLQTAAEDFERSLEIDPNNPHTWNTLAIIRWHIGQLYFLSSYASAKCATNLEPTNSAILDNYNQIAKGLNINPNDRNNFSIEQTLNQNLRIDTKWDQLDIQSNDQGIDHVKLEFTDDDPKVLILTSFFPPHHQDDRDLFLEKLYRDLVHSQIKTRVLTSDFVSELYQRPGLFPIPYPGIYRTLKLGNNFIDQLNNMQQLDSAVKNFDPDHIIFWDAKSFGKNVTEKLESYEIDLTDRREIESKTNTEIIEMIKIRSAK